MPTATDAPAQQFHDWSAPVRFRPDYSGRRFRAELAKVQRGVVRSASAWRMGFYLLVIAVAVPAVVAILADHLLDPEVKSNPDFFNAAFAGLAPYLLGSALLLLGCALWFNYRERALVRSWVYYSDIAVRIAGGDFAEDALFELTPWPWVYTLPRARKPDEGGLALKPLLLRIGGNLDWYLQPPKRLLRAGWLLPPALLFVLGLMGMGMGGAAQSRLANFTSGVTMFAPYYQAPQPPSLAERMYYGGVAAVGSLAGMWGLILAAAGLFVLLVFMQYRRQVWTEELVKHLVETLEA